ncbi:MAG TPA: hypothetical protein VMS45_06390 [Gemmatimonadaceae bacterium]|nr:hypothetical protein [Gemmatimonadaceae bacterium]
MTDVLRMWFEIGLLAAGVALGLYGMTCARTLPDERRPDLHDEGAIAPAKKFDELMDDVYTDRGDRIRRRMLWSFLFGVTLILSAFWLSLRK